MRRKRHNHNIKPLTPEELKIKQWKTAQYFELGLLNYIDGDINDEVEAKKYTDAQIIATEYIERCEDVPDNIKRILLERKRILDDKYKK